MGIKKKKAAIDESIDGPRWSRIQELGFVVLGFFLGIAGVLIAWAAARSKHRMECSAEGIFLGIIGWATSIVLWFTLNVCGVVASANLILLVALGIAAVPLSALCALPGSPIDGWAIFWLVVAVLFIIYSDLWVYGLRYKQTTDEKKRALPGDDWVKPDEPHLRYDGGVTIEAPASRVWEYVQQSGQTKAGWYSFDWLERLFTFDIHNHYDIHPEWQNLQPGEFQWFHQAPLSIGEWVTEVSHADPYGWAAHSDTATDPTYKNPGPNQEKALRLWFKRFCWTWNWQIYSLGQNRCRFIWRCDCTFAPYTRTPWSKYFVVFILGVASLVMGRRYFDVVSALAEGRMTYPPSKK